MKYARKNFNFILTTLACVLPNHKLINLSKARFYKYYGALISNNRIISFHSAKS